MKTVLECVRKTEGATTITIGDVKGHNYKETKPSR